MNIDRRINFRGFVATAGGTILSLNMRYYFNNNNNTKRFSMMVMFYLSRYTSPITSKNYGNCWLAAVDTILPFISF